MIDLDLLERLQYHLIEGPDGGANWPSGLWTRDEVLAAVNQRQAKFLKYSLLLVKESSPDLDVLPTQHRIDLPSDLIRLVSVIWIDGVTGAMRELLRSDSFEADHAIPSWDVTTTPAPLVYMEFETPTLQVQIAPAPTGFGSLHLLYIPKGAQMDGNGVPLTVPDEFGHAIGYGVLSDLLRKDGRGKDLTRADYCDQRVDLAVDLARLILKGWA